MFGSDTTVDTVASGLLASEGRYSGPTELLCVAVFDGS